MSREAISLSPFRFLKPYIKFLKIKSQDSVNNLNVFLEETKGPVNNWKNFLEETKSPVNNWKNFLEEK